MKENDPIIKVLDIFLEDAVAIAAEKMDCEEPESMPFELSKEHEIKMQKIFRRGRRHVAMRKVSIYARRAAVVLAAMIVVSGIMVFSVDAWRVRFLNMFVSETSIDSDIWYENGTIYKSVEIEIGFIPEDFVIVENTSTGQSIRLKFQNEDSFCSLIRYATNTVSSVDTENAETKKITINGNIVYVSVGDEITILSWSDNKYSYALSGNIDEMYLIRVAESIR